MTRDRLCLSYLLVVAACDPGVTASPAARQASVAVHVGALALPGVANACYRLTVSDALGRVVMDVPNVCADTYGDGQGSLAYVGVCDAARPESVLTLQVEAMTDLTGAALPLDSHPCAGDGCSAPFECRENGDAQVHFDLTTVRPLEAGFVSLTLDLEEIFCTVDAECRTPAANDAGGTSARTVALVLACTTDSDQAPALYRDRLEIACDGLAPLSLDPASEGPSDTWIAGQAVHRGVLADDEGGAPTAFWNIRLGLSDGPLPANCVLRTTATATAEAFVAGTAPADHPLVAIETQLTDALGAMACADPAATSHERGVTRGYAREPHTFEAGFVPEGERAE